MSIVHKNTWQLKPKENVFTGINKITYWKFIKLPISFQFRTHIYAGTTYNNKLIIMRILTRHIKRM
jgi:hypothetical protein